MRPKWAALAPRRISIMATDKPSLRETRLAIKTNPPIIRGGEVRFHARLLKKKFVGVISLHESGSGELHRLFRKKII